MTKHYRLFACFVIFGLILSSFTFYSCGIFSSLTADDESESETESNDTEPLPVETEDFQPITEPVIVTQEPEPEPPPINLGQDFSASGTIKSDTNHLLKLKIDWKAYQTSDTEYATIDITIYLECYAIMVGERSNSTLTVDGETKEFSTPRITNENNSLSSVELYKESMQIHNPAGIEKKSVEIAAAFYFGGTYGGEALGWIELKGEAQFIDDGSPIPISNEDEINTNPLAPELPADPFEPVEG